jgi:Leucine-rich repeat (LRR) protein
MHPGLTTEAGITTITEARLSREGLPRGVDLTRTTDLILERAGLTGIPLWLATTRVELPELRSLIIRNNPIELVDGLIIPERVRNLTINDGNVSVFPDSLPDRLSTLDLSRNRIDDPAGFENLPVTLRTLIVAENRLSLIPKRFALRILTKLVLDSNELTDLPSSLPNSIQHLSVCCNQLTELPSRLPRDLKTFAAASNYITEFPFDVFAKCARLTSLQLSENRIEMLEAGFFPSNLRSLDLSYNGLCLTETIVLPASIRALNLLGNNLDDFSHVKFAQVVRHNPLPRESGNTFPVRHGRWSRSYRTPFEEVEQPDLGGLTIILSHNPALSFIAPNSLPMNLVKLEIDNCSFTAVPRDLGTRPVQYFSAVHNLIGELRMDDIPTTLQELDLSRNRLSHIVQSIFPRTNRLVRVGLTGNFLRIIPSSFLESIVSTSPLFIQAGQNILETFPEPIPSNTLFLTLGNNSLTNLGSRKLPAGLQTLELSSNVLVSVSGPALLGLTSKITGLYLDDNRIRYISPQVREHLETIMAEDPDEDEWVNERRRQVIAHLPAGTIYADAQNVHAHSVQDSMRKSINSLRKAGLLQRAPDIEIVGLELLATRMKHQVLRDLFMHAGLIERESLPTTTNDQLLRIIVPASQRNILFDIEPTMIVLDDDPKLISFGDILRMAWTIIRDHPEREVMIKNIDEELSRVPCVTGLLGALIGGIAGFGGEAELIEIKISIPEQMAAIIESSSRMEGEYTVERHKQAAQAEMIERGFDQYLIDTWVAYIGI